MYTKNLEKRKTLWKISAFFLFCFKHLVKTLQKKERNILFCMKIIISNQILANKWNIEWMCGKFLYLNLSKRKNNERKKKDSKKLLLLLLRLGSGCQIRLTKWQTLFIYFNQSRFPSNTNKFVKHLHDPFGKIYMLNKRKIKKPEFLLR